MNTNEFQNKETVVCVHCSYNANSVGAKHCHKCGKRLIISSFPTKSRFRKFDFTPYVFLLIIAVIFLVFGLAGYYYGQELRFLGSNLNRYSDKTLSDIQLYNSMDEVPRVPKGTFNYGGSIVFAPLNANINQAISQAHPDFHLRYTEPKYNNPGNKTGINMLLDSELSFARSSKPLQDQDYRKANERSFSLQQVPVAIDGILLFTHLDVTIPGLSVEQIRDIYKGKITNWKQVGGANLPITAFASNPKFGATLSILLGPELGVLSPKVQFMRDYTNSVRTVASIPGAIGIGSTGAILGQHLVRPLAVARTQITGYIKPFTDDGKQINSAALRDGTYPLTRRLFVVIRRDGTLDEAAGVAYANLLLSKPGQQIVEKSGFVPLH